MATARVQGIAIDCRNAAELCAFYGALLDIEPENNGLVIHRDERGIIEIWFQEVEGYVGPTWPTQERGQQMHLDIDTEDRPALIARAIELGATMAHEEPGASFTTLLDPAGHPFCICDPH